MKLRWEGKSGLHGIHAAAVYKVLLLLAQVCLVDGAASGRVSLLVVAAKRDRRKVGVVRGRLCLLSGHLRVDLLEQGIHLHAHDLQLPLIMVDVPGAAVGQEPRPLSSRMPRPSATMVMMVLSFA